jgi:ribonuclease Z
MPSHHTQRRLPELPLNAAQILTAVPNKRRILLFGPMGVGKSTLARQLASALAQQQQTCWGLSADPGTPAFGVPGAVSLAKWQDEAWQVSAYVALCSLDAVRFRLPLLSAVRDLAQQLPEAPVLIDSPGVVRGVAGKELLTALVATIEVDAVLALTVEEQPPPLPDELRTLPVDVFVIHTGTKTMRPGKRVRARQRTALWDAHLANATEQQFDLDGFNLIGTPPPIEAPHSWIGRQVALLQANRTLAMGEVQQFKEAKLNVRLTGDASQADSLLVRDAIRNTDGYIETATPYAAEHYVYLPAAEVVPAMEISTGPRLLSRVGILDVGLINGVFGDPLLHLRLRHQRRSLLFDLGDGSRLPGRMAHQVTDIFISHAHMDHIGGFLWLLRARLGEFPVCRLYGPPGLARHIQGFLQGVLWDRIADRGPAFEVLELHGTQLQRYRLQAGYDSLDVLTSVDVVNDVLLQEAGFRIKGVSLDHHGTAVMAYALQAAQQLNVRKDRLRRRGLAPGPWLNELKQQLLLENETALIQLPDGSTATAASLAQDLVIITPGKKLAYATDLADTPQNRQRLINLARHAHTFFCEAPFMEAESDNAQRNGHLTTRACGEIASEAEVSRLVPFHFSRRYADNPQALYEEIERYCPQVLAPTSWHVSGHTSSKLNTVVELNN